MLDLLDMLGFCKDMLCALLLRYLLLIVLLYMVRLLFMLRT